MEAPQFRSIRAELRRTYIVLVAVALALFVTLQAACYWGINRLAGGWIAVTEELKTTYVFAAAPLLIGLVLLLFLFIRRRYTEAVVAPIDAFTQALSGVVHAGDYSFRFESNQCAELTGLANVCNELFSNIETNEKALTNTRSELQSQVKALRHQISERKLAQAASARLTAILEATPDFVGTFDPVGGVLYLNSSARRMIGATEDDSVASRKFSDFHPGWASRIISTEGIPGALHAGSWVGETAVRHNDGREIHVSQVIIAHRNATSGLEYFSTIMRDITDRRAAEEALRVSQEKLLETSRLAGRAEVATGVLHNVGNVLNSVNVSAGILLERLRKSKAPKLVQAATMLSGHNGDLGEWITKDPNGAKIPGYLVKLGEYFTAENHALLEEIEQLVKNIEHIKEVVAMQQCYAKVNGAFEELNIEAIVNDAISFNSGVLNQQQIKLERNFNPVPRIRTDRHKVLQILVNLIRNARHAIDDMPGNPHKITITVEATGSEMIGIRVSDTGVGIPPENLTKIFAHGFTTRRNGHGFGLHSGALAARELGGTLTVESEGSGLGSSFTLSLPVTQPEDSLNGIAP
jgi:PAS domain S-box-containing protein